MILYALKFNEMNPLNNITRQIPFYSHFKEEKRQIQMTFPIISVSYNNNIFNAYDIYK